MVQCNNYGKVFERDFSGNVNFGLDLNPWHSSLLSKFGDIDFDATRKFWHIGRKPYLMHEPSLRLFEMGKKTLKSFAVVFIDILLNKQDMAVLLLRFFDRFMTMTKL